MRIYNKSQTKEIRKTLRKRLTDAERKIWGIVRNRKIKGLKFFRQYGVGRYILDFYCPSIKLCIEIDGGQHNLEVDKLYDKERTEYLNSIGVYVIRFWNNDVLNNIEGVYEEIVKTI